MLTAVFGEGRSIYGEAGAHVAGEVEGRDAGAEPERCKGMPEILDPAADRVDPSSRLGGLPFAVAEVVQFEVAARAAGNMSGESGPKRLKGVSLPSRGVVSRSREVSCGSPCEREGGPGGRALSLARGADRGRQAVGEGPW